MSDTDQITYTLAFGGGKLSRVSRARTEELTKPVPRIARLMALAIRFEGLVQTKTVRDYAELARRGHVTRARMSQIMKMLDLAPDLQERLLVLPPIEGLNERNLRPILRHIDWDQQRTMFTRLAGDSHGH